MRRFDVRAAVVGIALGIGGLWLGGVLPGCSATDETSVVIGSDTGARDAGGAPDAQAPDGGAPGDTPAASDAAAPDVPAVDGFGDAAADAGPAADAGTDTGSDPTTSCSSCHGDESSPAPPLDLEGNELTTARGVGAHRSHLRATAWHDAVACDECHIVPETPGAAGHWDSQYPAELTWGPLATAGGGAPSWDGERCSSTYCHGGTLTAGGGRNTAPQWTLVDGTEAACGSCHGLPPATPHPTDDACASCHPTIDAERNFLAPSRHIDGHVDVASQLTCDTCHGSDGNPAPPLGVNGEQATSARAVGAHRSHLGTSSWHAQVACNACHRVPTDLADAGHTDSELPAELEWGTRARMDGATPTWDGETCSSTYCHGATLNGGGSNTAPTWTVVDGTQAACGSCHALPPAPPHIQSDTCVRCHPTVDAERRFVDPTRHIDGTVTLSGALTCDACHGSNGNPAPPRALDGTEATTSRGVGAHRSHLRPATWHAQVACGDCHLVPEAIETPGHADSDPPAELSWSALATTGGSTPAWDGQRCSSTYCHGGTLAAGGSNTAPAWTVVDAGEAACGSCHALPPPAPHPQSDACAACHPTIAGDGLFVAPERHIDGHLDVEMTTACDACHGGGGNPAPPVALNGEDATTERGVGAHRSHLRATDWHAAIGCGECHVVPTTVTSAGHVDSDLPAELRWGALATADEASPTWDGSACSSTYCHGGTLIAGGTNTTPTWTRVDDSQAACGTCHGLPPAAPHPASQDCATCHGDVIRADRTFVDPVRHVDGVVQVASAHPTGWVAPSAHGAAFDAGGVGACSSCHGATLTGGSSGVSCDDCHGGWSTNCTFCHGGQGDSTGAPPFGVDGETSRTSLAVGAHAAHVRTTSMHTAWSCGVCHPTWGSALTPGHIDGDSRAEVVFGAPSAGGSYAYGTGTCSSSYCHGNGRTNGSAEWDTDPTLTCQSCHTNNGLGGEHREHVGEGVACYRCHSTVVNSSNGIVGLALHVNGSRDVSFSTGGTWNPATRTCTGVCHGSEHW